MFNAFKKKMNKKRIEHSHISKADMTKGAFCILVLIFMIAYPLILKDRLSKDQAYTKGIIVNKSYPWKGQPFIYYNFVIQDSIYKGGTRYSHHLQEINIGDTCYIRYEANDPINNNLIKSEKDDRLFKIKKPISQ